MAGDDETGGRAGLKRAVTRWEIVGLSLNDVIGSGVYLLPAAAAALLGAASLWAVLLAGFAVLLLVLCFAEAGSHFDEPGSGYVYAREAFGDFVGFEVGWMTWLARVASVASLSNGFALALTFLWPAASSGAPRVLVITLPLALFVWINVAGVEHGARLAVGLTITKIAAAAVPDRGRPARRRLVPHRPRARAGDRRASGRRPRCCCSPTPASRTRRRRPASTRTRAGTSRSRS